MLQFYTASGNNEVFSVVSELCQSGREWTVPLVLKWSFIMQKTEQQGFFLEACQL